LKSRLNIIEEFHENLLNQPWDKSIIRPKICGWSGMESQEARFSALMRTLKYNGGSIIDFGCGTGDLYAFIVRNYGQVQYTGMDCNERMLDIARETHNAEFIQCSFDEINLKQAEFVVASGVFQFKDASNPNYYVQLVKGLFSKSHNALAVNFLSAKRSESEKNDYELYLEPSQVVHLAESISPMWAIDHSYHLGFGDVTMALFHADTNQVWKRPT
jgi:cyclopropane fatty-acyl-phospholipid synthase-like methyltransferase